jgi:hypothetical protein
MRATPNEPIASTHGGIWLQCSVGAIALVVGIALAWLFAFIATKVAARPIGIDITVLVVESLVGGAALFFLTIGWRMALNRPNKQGSILSPWLWYLLAVFFLVCAAAIAYQITTQQQFNNLEVPATAFVFSLLAALAGRRVARKSPQRPPSEA